ncbi:SDR family NAD(P)-dependent oxidoreductase [Haliea atlantica]|jgi:NAD(P)-dependent dehydrogenase (short-subunit alcohol dehydrogenase family)|nr:short-chain dehydrogenase [Haliea sp.]|tara:strand:+ start:143724 stop:144557 length:834 start_codon:yes stop_codon:yes gene_type:complete
MDLQLQGKTAIITGGSGGIGRGLVLEFAREGLNVVSASRDLATGEKLAAEAAEMGLSGKVLAVKTDVTDRASVDAMVAKTREAFGPVDVLVNNAGGVAHPSDFEKLDADARRWEIALNVDGVVNCCQAVAEDMLSRQTGSIINVSSNSSLLGEAAANIVHYGGVKGFVNSFSKGLAWEWARKGVRVNNICPGWIVPRDESEVGEGSFWNRFGFETMGKPDDMEKALEEGSLYNMSGLPIPRLGRPEDIAWLALFLASERSGYITGQMVSVSGGAWMP